MKKFEDDELKEIFRELEEQGLEPMLCDTPVPYYDNRVMCGTPNELGDIVVDDEIMLPGSWTDIDRTFITTVQGDSMKDADILEGDKVVVVATTNYQDGDILFISIDHASTLKAFCHDEEGRPWLIPLNVAYNPFPLEDHQNIKVVGVVQKIIKMSPRVNYSSCISRIKAIRPKYTKVKEVGLDVVKDAIRKIALEIEVARHWFAVYKILVEVKVVKPKDYDGFCEMVKAEVPDHEYLPNRVEMQRLDVQSFAKPVSKWDADDAPAKGKRFYAYLKVAQRMRELLGVD